MNTKLASKKSRQWARLAIKVAVESRGKEIEAACTTPATAISFDEFLRRFKGGTLKLKKQGKDAKCGCHSVRDCIYDVFDVGNPWSRTDSKTLDVAKRAFRAAAAEETRRVSLEPLTETELAAAVKRIQTWPLPKATKF